jgi:hypothetical protein
MDLEEGKKLARGRRSPERKKTGKSTEKLTCSATVRERGKERESSNNILRMIVDCIAL